jgi:hypothetical protein
VPEQFVNICVLKRRVWLVPLISHYLCYNFFISLVAVVCGCVYGVFF